VRPFGKLVYLMPPYIISDEQLEVLCGAMVEVISQSASIR
jgi:adenosylmethionine-8-amino-7-oxononanoate aminotransferase